MKLASRFCLFSILLPCTTIAVDVPGLVANDERLNTFATTLYRADLIGALSDPAGPFTVFAPTDEAYDSLLSDVLQCFLLPKYKTKLIDLLENHIVEGKIMSSNLVDGMTITTLHGKTNIDLSNIVSSNIEGTNGVIHLIDKVIVPEDLDQKEFFRLCRDSLDISTMMIADKHFNTLPEIINTAGLRDVLSDPEGPYTVFAPPDFAFTKLPDGLIDCLLQPENKDTLIRILQYHVVEGKIMSNEMRRSSNFELKSINGDILTINADSSNGGEIKINDGSSTMISPDAYATNGVIHAIDTVLFPKDIDPNKFIRLCGRIVSKAVISSSSSSLHWNGYGVLLSIGILFVLVI